MQATPSSPRSSLRKAKPDQPGYDENRQRIVDEAISLMAERGFQRLRFDDLARRVGLNRTTLYRYFDSKRELVTACMCSLMMEITDGILHDTSELDGTSPDDFAETLHGIIHRLRTDERYGVIMDPQNVEQFAELSQARMGEVTERVLSRFLLDAASGRVLREDLRLEEVVPWIFHQVISHGFLGVPGTDEPARKAYLRRMVVPVLFG